MTHSKLDIHSILTTWTFSPSLFLILLLVFSLYVYMWKKAKAPISYLCFTTIGFLIIFYALFSFLDVYNQILFSIHVIQHMLMAMVATPFLALGRPIKMILKSSNPPIRKLVSKVAHIFRFFLDPIFSGLFMIGTLYTLYFSALYGHTLNNEFLHSLVHFHMILTGLLFSISILGVDSFKVSPVYLRLLALFITLPLHAFLGISIMTSDKLIAMHHFMNRTWGPSPRLDQYIGGSILWASGDISSIIYIIVIFAAWSKASEKKGRSLNKINKIVKK